MQTKTEATADKNLRQIVNENLRWLQAFGFFGAGVLMASSGLFDTISPFGVAFCGSLNGTSLVASAFGAVLGYTFFSPVSVNMKYIAAVTLVSAVKLLFGGQGARVLGKALVIKRNAALSVASVFFAMLISGTAIIFSSDYTFYDLMLGFSEILTACGAAYFFTRGMESLKTGLNNAPKPDISCAIISMAIVVMGFERIMISGVSVGRVLSMLAILLAARYGGEAAGSVAGITAGIAMSLGGGDMNYVIAAYALGGLIAGVFGAMGRIAAAGSFIGVNALTAFLIQDTHSLYISLFECFAASVIFVAVPSALIGRLRPARKASSDVSCVRVFLRDRLSDIASALYDMGATTRRVGKELEKIENTNEREVAVRAVDRICRRCSMKNTCWQFSYNDTRDALNEAVETLKRNGSITRSRMPRHLASNCIKSDDLLTELNTQFQSHISREGAAKRVAQVRNILTTQFEGLSRIMSEMSEQITEIKSFDEEKARRIRDYFERAGIGARRVAAFTDENDRINITFVMPNYHIAKLNRKKATLDLCGILETELDLPQITARKQQATVVFVEKTNFAIEFGAYQIAGGGGKLCGDSYDFIKNKGGKAHFILSDGMGSGGAAAVDSSMASSLISQLISSGVSHTAALGLVNSALMIKSGEESMATLDVSSIDLYTGKADFYKAGAAPTYIIKNGKAGYTESPSLPVGILRNVAFEHDVVSLRENDVVVMLSDGVTATGTDWVKTELEYLKSGDMQRMCERLAATAKNRRSDNHEDDITVLAAALRRIE